MKYDENTTVYELPKPHCTLWLNRNKGDFEILKNNHYVHIFGHPWSHFKGQLLYHADLNVSTSQNTRRKDFREIFFSPWLLNNNKLVLSTLNKAQIVSLLRFIRSI